MIFMYGFLAFVLAIVLLVNIMKWKTISSMKRQLGTSFDGKYLMLHGISYEVIFLQVPHRATLYVNSPYVIEIQHQQSVIKQYELKKGYVFIIYPSNENMLVTLNENEVRFFDEKERIHGSYFVRRAHIQQFIRSQIND